MCACTCVCVFMKEWVVNGARVLRKEEEGAGREKNSMSWSCIMKRFWNLIYKNGCVFSLTSSSLSFLPPHSAQKHWSKMRLSDWSHTPTLGLFWERDFFFSSLLIYFVALAERILQDSVSVCRFATVWLVPLPCAALWSGKQGQSLKSWLWPHFSPSLVASQLATEYSVTVPLPYGLKELNI